MREKILLPFDESKILSSPETAFPYALLKANFGPELDAALCRRFINCYFDLNSKQEKFEISLSDHWCENYNITQSYLVSLSKSTFQSLKIDLTEFFKKSLQGNNYIYGKSELSFLPDQIPHVLGPFHYFITGYDDYKGVFRVRLFDGNHQYYAVEVPFRDTEDSLWCGSEDIVTFQLWTVDKSVEIPLKMPNIARELEDYVLSKNSKWQYSKDKSFGMQAIDDLNAYLYQRAKEVDPLEIYYLRALADHKYFMKERILYLAEKGEISDEWIPYANDVYVLAEPLVMLGEQYNQTRDFSIAQEIHERIERFMEIEKSYLPKVLEQIVWHWDEVRE